MNVTEFTFYMLAILILGFVCGVCYEYEEWEKTIDRGTFIYKDQPYVINKAEIKEVMRHQKR